MHSNVPEGHAGVQVLPGSSEFQVVQERMAETMAHSTIHKLERVQNLALWDYYSMKKLRLARLGIEPNEVSLWHGTSRTDPAAIYADVQDGFMVRPARHAATAIPTAGAGAIILFCC